MKNRKKRINTYTFIIIILLILIGISGCVLYKNINQDFIPLGLSDNQIQASDPNLLSRNKQDTFELVGYGQLEIDDTYPNINLINPKDNAVYLKFDVIYNDEILYSTKLIEPGKMEQFNIYSCLDAGEHTLIYSIDVISMETKEVTWPGIRQEQEILIRK